MTRQTDGQVKMVNVAFEGLMRQTHIGDIVVHEQNVKTRGHRELIMNSGASTEILGSVRPADRRHDNAASGFRKEAAVMVCEWSQQVSPTASEPQIEAGGKERPDRSNVSAGKPGHRQPVPIGAAERPD